MITQKQVNMLIIGDDIPVLHITSFRLQLSLTEHHLVLQCHQPQNLKGWSFV
jgi:hypothetical protein